MTSWNDILLETESYLERYRNALKEILDVNCKFISEDLEKIRSIAQIALDGEPTTADKFNEVQDHGPPYSMANPTGEPVKAHPLAARYTTKGIQDDLEC